MLANWPIKDFLGIAVPYTHAERCMYFIELCICMYVIRRGFKFALISRLWPLALNIKPRM